MVVAAEGARPQRGHSTPKSRSINLQQRRSAALCLTAGKGQGRDEDSIATLTDLIRRHRLSVPPPPKTLVIKDGDPGPYK